jgi:hypothetical protein
MKKSFVAPALHQEARLSDLTLGCPVSAIGCIPFDD